MKPVQFLALTGLCSLMLGCNGGGTLVLDGPAMLPFSSPLVTADGFVTALNNVDRAFSRVELQTWQTHRSTVPGEQDWFVIWDDKWSEYKAVNLQYIRAIVYHDYYINSVALAGEFRSRESNDISNNRFTGDQYGRDYEDVVFDSITNSYWGRNSGFEYEQAVETKDVNLIAAIKEQKDFYEKASKISFLYKLSIETSLSLVSLGMKVQKYTKRGDLTAQDQIVLMADVEHLTGASWGEFCTALEQPQYRGQLIEEVAKKLGTTSINLENKLLPQLFNLPLNK